MAEEKKKRGFLSKLGFKSKEEKLAEEAANRAAQQKLVDDQMAARMAAINAAALKSAREQDEGKTETSAEEIAAIEAEEKRQAEIQAARDVARAKQLAEERARKAEAEKAAAEDTARKAKEAAEREAEQARLKAEAELKREAEIKARAEEEARIRAEEAKALAEAEAKSKAEAAALKARQAAEAKARAEAEAARELEEKHLAEEARLKAEAEEAARIEAERLAAEKAEQKRLKQEAEEAERRATIAAEQAAREQVEREAREAKRAEEAAKEREAAIARGEDPDAPKSDPMAEGGFLGRITTGLKKSTSRMSDSVSAAFTKRTLDDAALEELEDILIASDLGVGVATKVTSRLAADKFDKQVTDLEVKIALADVISDILTPLEKPIALGLAKPQILLFVGVNGSGKTTTLGKIAKRYRDQGKKVLIAAGDTFRAAAVEQLTVWGERADAPVMSAKPGADAAGLVYDAITRAREEDFDILMIDTAGRLQNRTELMDELSKIIRVIEKQDPSAPHHSILVLDATVGQNALLQTEAFRETAKVSGLIMTKLDGTAKGGVLVALSDKFGLPIHHIGIGERIEDLENFSAPVFAAALSGVADAMKE
ncbi:signal recognition particle-docking protein FtsY [Litorimonas sp. RW-G-Af-16]|uniref:signal recognition particle-docking protein FtsY n=1 Tax=Litorimonas sp. RW-G-Af-16 TaxID=3241168 RepID=UPI00390C6F2B